MAKPGNAIFVAKRAWDQRAEVGCMKRIEDAFQELASKIIDGTVYEIGAADKAIINDFRGAGICRSRKFKQKESKAAATLRSIRRKCAKRTDIASWGGGKWPARQLNGLGIQILVNRYFDSLSSAQWGIIQAQEGKFIVPGISIHTIAPITPTLCLVSPAPNRIILSKMWRG